MHRRSSSDATQSRPPKPNELDVRIDVVMQVRDGG